MSLKLTDSNRFSFASVRTIHTHSIVNLMSTREKLMSKALWIQTSMALLLISKSFYQHITELHEMKSQLWTKKCEFLISPITFLSLSPHLFLIAYIGAFIVGAHHLPTEQTQTDAFSDQLTAEQFTKAHRIILYQRHILSHLWIFSVGFNCLNVLFIVWIVCASAHALFFLLCTFISFLKSGKFTSEFVRNI